MNFQKNSVKSQFEKDRHEEIKKIQEFLLKGNLVVKGEIGQGKTSAIMAATKNEKLKVTEINVLNINPRNSVDIELFKQLNGWGKTNFCKKRFWFWLYKYFVPFSLTFIGVLISSLLPFSIKKEISHFSWFSLFAPLAILFLIISCWCFAWCLTYGQKNRRILVSELNFKSDIENILPHIWTLKQIYKNSFFVFEAPLGIFHNIKSKFNCNEILIGPSPNIKFLIDNLIVEIEEIIKNQVFEKRILNLCKNWIKKSLEQGELHYMVIQEFSYRELMDVLKEFKTAFISYKGEINFLDFLIASLLSKTSSKFLSYLANNLSEIERAKYSEKTRPQNKNPSDSDQKTINLLIQKKDEENVSSKIIGYLQKSNWIPTIDLEPTISDFSVGYRKSEQYEEESWFRFFQKKYVDRYLKIFRPSSPHGEIANLLFEKKEHFNFIKNYLSANSDYSFPWFLIKNKEIIELLNSINNFDKQQMFSINQTPILSENFLKLPFEILTSFGQTRAKEFFEKLELAHKIGFIYSYAIIFCNTEEGKILVKNFKTNWSSKKIKEALNNSGLNFFSKTRINNQMVEFFDENDYLESLIIKNKMNLLKQNVIWYDFDLKTATIDSKKIEIPFLGIDKNLNKKTQQLLIEFLKRPEVNTDKMSIIKIDKKKLDEIYLKGKIIYIPEN